jgi:hypothetical protein
MQPLTVPDDRTADQEPEDSVREAGQGSDDA